MIVGNCQARPIAEILPNLNSNIEVSNIAIVHLLKNDQFNEYEKDFIGADYIITQLIADNYPCEFMRSTFLQSRYGKKVITIINLFYSGYTPDWRYVRIPGKGTLKGPMSDYHNQTIIDSWLKGLSTDETLSLVLDRNYNIDKYSSVVNSSLIELKKRELNADVKIVDYIEKKMYSERLFFTFNHPCISLIYEYVMRVLMFLRIDFEVDESYVPKESLNQLIPILNSGLDFNFHQEEFYKGVKLVSLDGSSVIMGKTQKYNLNELIVAFYKVYDVNSGLIKSRFPNAIL